MSLACFFFPVLLECSVSNKQDSEGQVALGLQVGEGQAETQ